MTQRDIWGIGGDHYAFQGYKYTYSILQPASTVLSVKVLKGPFQYFFFCSVIMETRAPDYSIQKSFLQLFKGCKCGARYGRCGAQALR